MSGTSESGKTAKEKVQYWDEILDNYEQSVGLPKYEPVVEDTELAECLQLNRDTLEKLSSQECAYRAFVLSKYAFNIQRAQNRENAIVGWAKSTIKELIANELSNFKDYSYEAKYIQAVKNNTHATKIQQILTYAEQRAARLNYLSKSLESMANFVRSIQYNKVNHE